jgi:hypothetical protein
MAVVIQLFGRKREREPKALKRPPDSFTLDDRVENPVVDLTGGKYPHGIEFDENLANFALAAILGGIDEEKVKLIMSVRRNNPLSPTSLATARQYFADWKQEDIAAFVNGATEEMVKKKPSFYVVALERLRLR